MIQFHLNIFRPMLCIGLFFGTNLSAQDFLSLHLKARFDTINESIDALVRHSLTQVNGGDELYLNAPQISIDSLRWNGVDYDFRQNDTAIFIKVEKALDTNILEIKYHAKPIKGLYFIGWQDESRRAPRQIWTQGQGIDHRHWIPHHDKQTDKIVFSCDIEFASNYEVMANGKLDSVLTLPNTKRWFYSMEKPMSSYLIALVIGKYGLKQTQSFSDIKLSQYYYPERVSDYRYYYFQNEAIFNFLESEIGIPFPWQNYKQAPVQDFRHGAMENTTATIFGDFFLVDSLAFPDRNYTYVNAHELAHQWFGNLVTATSSKHHWLHEGYATYYQWLSEREIYGQDFFDWERHKAKELVFSATAAGALPLAHPQAGSERFYQKGAWLLYMLAQRMGEEKFRKANQLFLQKYAYAVADSDSLQIVMETVCACSLDDFFATWLYADSEPIITAHLKEDSLELQSDQNLAQALTIRYFSGARLLRDEKIDLTIGKHQLALPEGANNFALVNASEILAQFRVEKSDLQWRNYYADSLPVLEKLRIVEALQAQEKESITLLEEVLNEDQHFAGLRAAALNKLCSLPHLTAKKGDYLSMALNSHEPLLILAALRQTEPTQFPELLAKLRKNGPSYEVRLSAMHNSINLKNRAANRWLYDEEFKSKPGFPAHKLYIAALFYRVALYQDEEAYRELLDFASLSFDFLTRMEAITYLGYLKINDLQSFDVLFAALFHRNWKLSKTAREVLIALYQKDSTSLEAYKKVQESKWTDFQKRRAALIFTAE